MNITFSGEFTKVDKVRRLVTGIATADNIDKEDDVTDFRGSLEAFKSWPGNVREMHMPIAVGNLVKFNPVSVFHDGREYDGIETTVYVSKGAESTWEKVLDGTLKGFSIGGDIVEASMEYDRELDKSYRHIKKYRLHELSLVDNPANPASLISMVKMEGDNLVYKAAKDIENIHELFYCPNDRVAKVDDQKCSVCDDDMQEIGFIEDFDSEEIKKMIDIYENGGENKHTALLKNDNADSLDIMSDTLDTVQKEKVLDRLSKFIFGDESGPEESSLFSPTFNINIGGEVAPSGVAPADDVSEDSLEEEDSTIESLVEDSSDDASETAEAEDAEGASDSNEEDTEVNADEVVGKLAEVLDAKLEQFEKTVDGKIEEVTKSVDAKIEEVSKSVEEQADSLNKFAESGAISKSEDIASDEDGEDEGDSVEDDSFWKGLFVPREVSAILGYRS